MLKTWLKPQEWSFDRFLLWIAGLMLLGMALLVPLQSDTWWLLRTGQDIVQQRTIITTDLYSWTNQGNFWPNHEWLTQALMYLFYAIGGFPLLLGIFAGIIVFTWHLIYRSEKINPKLAILFLTLGIVDNAKGWSVRPQIITICLFVLLILMIQNRKYHWWIIPFMLVWANLHAGFVVGMVLIGIITAVNIVQRQDVVRWLAISALSFLASLCNPHSYELWLFTLNSLDSSTYAYIEEWQPQKFTKFASYPYFLLVTVLGLVWYRRRYKPSTNYEWFLVLATILFGIMAFRSVRQNVFFDVLAVLLLFKIYAVTPYKPGKFSAFEPMQGVILGLTAIIAIGLVSFSWLQRTPLLSPAILDSMKNCPGNIYNTYNSGGDLIWYLPERPVFIDNRFDPYPTDFMNTSMQVEDNGQYQPLFEQYKIECALVEIGSPIGKNLQADNWQIISQNQTYQVFSRP